jgi:hypothetical protein
MKRIEIKALLRERELVRERERAVVHRRGTGVVHERMGGSCLFLYIVICQFSATIIAVICYHYLICIITLHKTAAEYATYYTIMIILFFFFVLFCFVLL